jgi:hypothetical protein
MAPLENERQSSSDCDKRPDKTWFDVNHVDIRQKKYESTGEKYPGSYAAMKGTILVQLAKQPIAAANRIVAADEARSGCHIRPRRLRTPHAASETANQ